MRIEQIINIYLVGMLHYLNPENYKRQDDSSLQACIDIVSKEYVCRLSFTPVDGTESSSGAAVEEQPVQ